MMLSDQFRELHQNDKQRVQGKKKRQLQQVADPMSDNNQDPKR